MAIEVGVADAGRAADTLTLIRSFRRFGSKFVPLIVTAVPGMAMTGAKPDIAGGPAGATTVKLDAVVAEPAGDVTEMGPVVAPFGTVTTSWLDEAEIIAAVAPLNCTEF